MAGAKAFLTLNLPERGLASGMPVVASYNPRLLRLFKQIVLKEWADRVKSATNRFLEEVDRLEFEKLKATLDLLVPENGTGAGDGEAQG